MNQIEFLVGRNVSRIHNSMKLEAHCRQSRKLKKESMKITRGVARGVRATLVIACGRKQFLSLEREEKIGRSKVQRKTAKI